ncbi:hypothetical protein [Streptomyces sp. NPDC046942]|uniref:hypothetical protein n=1 Tax=Streptomyces sp. NPDC046942 TaxID=3155137 RepID=UPI00340931B1
MPDLPEHPEDAPDGTADPDEPAIRGTGRAASRGSGTAASRATGTAATRGTDTAASGATGTAATRGTGTGTAASRDSRAPETDAERRRRRAQFLRDLAEARELRARVQPRRAKAARLRHAMRMRTFRW